MSKFAYIRVSTRDQNEARQLLAISDLHIPQRNIYIDHQSGKDFNRPAYRRMVRRMKKDDLLYIKSIDRLGRNYEEIQNQWRYLTEHIGVDICIIDMPLLDTRQYKDLLGTFIADLVLQILSFVAESERENIKKRQSQGISAAKAKGIRFGRPEAYVPKNFVSLVKRWRNRQIPLKVLLKACSISRSTFFRKIQEMGL
jgi:DNA invertase Pin-like site-specific DNA recombinase